jgi:hypothetical protein
LTHANAEKLQTKQEKMHEKSRETNRAETLKNEGNAHFGKGDYVRAISQYSQALAECSTKSDAKIDADDENVCAFKSIVHSNRAAAYLKINDFTRGRFLAEEFWNFFEFKNLQPIPIRRMHCNWTR